MSEASRPIAILGGTGPAGTGIALRWARAGETIIIGSRETRVIARAGKPPLVYTPRAAAKVSA